MPISAYTPALSDVVPLVRNRTRDANGNTLGTFTPAATGTTTPSQEDATAMIAAAVLEAYPIFGDDIPDNPGDTTRAGYDVDALRKAAKRAVAYRAAALIELTYYADQVSSSKSPYPMLMETHKDLIKSVGTAIQQAGTGDIPGTSDDVPVALYDNLPNTNIIGWGTIF